MSGEQHVPAEGDRVVVTITGIVVAASRHNRWFNLQTDGGRVESITRDLDGVTVELASEVRALPDRETIARLIYPESWQPPLIPETYRAAMRAESLDQADAVLALFGQEGQR